MSETFKTITNSGLTTFEKNQLAYNCIEEGDEEKALNILMANYEEDPCLQTACNLAYCYLNIGTYGEDKKLHLQPHKAINVLNGYHNYIAFSLLGFAYYQIKDYKKSLKYYRSAIEERDDMNYIINYALLLCCNTEYKEALRFFERVYFLNSKNLYIKYCIIYCKSMICNRYSGFEQDIKSLKRQCIINQELGDYTVDVLEICYLYILNECYGKAIDVFNEYSNEFFLEPQDFKIIAFAMSKVGENDAIRLLYSKLNEEYSESCSIPMLEKIKELNLIYKDKYYLKKPSIFLTVELRNQCSFFGCLRHNNSWEIT